MTTQETQRLYYGFGSDIGNYATDISRDNWDNYVITLYNCTELREHCRAIASAECANANRVETALRTLFSWLADGDHEEVGTVEEEGWYEPPHYSWADPAAACDAEGGITSAMVDVRYSEADTEGGAYHIIDEAISVMFGDEAIDDEEEILLRTCQRFIAKWVAHKIHEYEGTDVSGAI